MDNRDFDGKCWYKKNGYWWNEEFGYQHRYVWQQAHQATIDDGDEIHHLDFNRENNEIKNLELLSKAEHKSIHMTGFVHSQYSRNKMSKSRIGNKNALGNRFSLSDEANRKKSESLKGNKNALGKIQSSETCLKKSQAMKRYWEKRTQDNLRDE